MFILDDTDDKPLSEEIKAKLIAACDELKRKIILDPKCRIIHVAFPPANEWFKMPKKDDQINVA